MYVAYIKEGDMRTYLTLPLPEQRGNVKFRSLSINHFRLKNFVCLFLWVYLCHATGNLSSYPAGHSAPGRVQKMRTQTLSKLNIVISSITDPLFSFVKIENGMLASSLELEEISSFLAASLKFTIEAKLYSRKCSADWNSLPTTGYCRLQN